MASTYKVYRVEHRTLVNSNTLINRGCYSLEFDGFKEMIDQHADEDQWPGFRTDFPNFCNTDDTFDYYCAFESLEQLHAWFGEYWLNKILADDFIVSEYEVALMIRGRSKKQVFFNYKGIIGKKEVQILEVSN